MLSLLSGQQAKKEPTISRLSQNKETIDGLALLRRHAEDGIFNQDEFTLCLHGGKLRVILVAM
ncbi:MAG TPA: hypothetical protein VMP08_24025 [Anaerolineae bacterium]|nr:hypothetical protein [Anaerolineae bacterium]